jgi:predicted ester cyclase
LLGSCGFEFFLLIANGLNYAFEKFAGTLSKSGRVVRHRIVIIKFIKNVMTNKEIVKAWFKAIDTNNYDSLKALMHEQHAFSNPMTPAPVGIQEHLGMIKGTTDALGGEHVLDLVLQDGEYVVVRGSWNGKHIGEFNGIAATGKPVHFTFTDIFHIVDGKVKEEYFELNPMAIMAQIGATAAN